MSSKGNDEAPVMHSRNDNIELMIHDKVDEIIKELFQPPLCKYKIGFETSIKGSDFIFGCVNLLQYRCHKINFKLGASYIDSPDWKKT